MRIGTNGTFHLTYCTNIHPGEHWPKVFSNLKKYIPLLKAQFVPEGPFGIGLRLSDIASRELLEGPALSRLKMWLRQNNLYVFTLNGFPYGGFHRKVVKEKVYAPDWSNEKRRIYTVRLAKILAQLLPEGMDGGISTVPVSYKPWFKHQEEKNACLEQACYNLAHLVQQLVRLQNESGKWIHLDLEPEPNGMLENSMDVIEFFEEWLLPKGSVHLAKVLDISVTLAREHLLRHIGMCYDTCHFAVSYEKPESVFERLEQAGIRIGKIQISAALKLKLPESIEARQIALKRLEPFAESTYLHQVVEKRIDGSFHTYPDLIEALPLLRNTTKGEEEWRIHFHVPIFIEDYQTLQSTQEDIITVLKLLENKPVCNHLEIETYTWEVLPAEMKKNIAASIRREYEWVLNHFPA